MKINGTSCIGIWETANPRLKNVDRLIQIVGGRIH